MSELTPSDFEKLSQYIYRKSGIFLTENKFSTLSRKLNKLLEERKYSDFRSFFHDLRFNLHLGLLQEIINVVTVNETYFYRENHQFDILVNKVLYELDKALPHGESIRILCAPSSTGEEPYSIALHLLNEKKIVERRDIEIIGIDIDSSVISKAKKGLYAKRSVQFVPPKVLREYFKPVGLDFQIVDFLRDAIEFKIVNVMEKASLRQLGKFDIVFSRNMLIYFDDASKREVVLNFYEMLRGVGYLFLGHADNINRASSLFKTVKYGDNLVYKKSNQ